MLDVGYAAEFSCPFFAATGFQFEVRISVQAAFRFIISVLMVSNLHFVSSAVAQSPLGGYLYSPAPVKPMPTRQVSIPSPDLFSRSDGDGSTSISQLKYFWLFSTGLQRWRCQDPEVVTNT
jgi:hypothetical protein